MQKIVGIKRNGDKNIYHFLQTEEYNIGDKVVVDFDDFQTVATVYATNIKVDDEKGAELPKIKRKATPADIKKYEDLSKKAKDNLLQIKRKSQELGLVMKFVGAEYSLDGSKIVIVFSSEERVDFRQFLKELATMLKTRIELKQIGQRDEIKIVGGVGPCGQRCCCSRFLKDFEHVTVKMAKIQGLSLSPTKINGICGRLMCCLGYESENYEKTLAKMPKIGTSLTTPNGTGTVVYNDILRERVSIKRQADGDTYVVEDFALEDIDMHNMKIIIKKEEVVVKTGEEKQPEKVNDQKQNNKKLENKNVENKNSESKNTEQQKQNDKKGFFKKKNNFRNKSFNNNKPEKNN